QGSRRCCVPRASCPRPGKGGRGPGTPSSASIRLRLAVSNSCDRSQMFRFFTDAVGRHQLTQVSVELESSNDAAQLPALDSATHRFNAFAAQHFAELPVLDRLAHEGVVQGE